MPLKSPYSGMSNQGNFVVAPGEVDRNKMIEDQRKLELKLGNILQH
jgi:hypothetical protein